MGQVQPINQHDTFLVLLHCYEAFRFDPLSLAQLDAQLQSFAWFKTDLLSFSDFAGKVGLTFEDGFNRKQTVARFGVLEPHLLLTAVNFIAEIFPREKMKQEYLLTVMNEGSTFAELFCRLSSKRLDDKYGRDGIPILKVFQGEFRGVETLAVEVVIMVADCNLIAFLQEILFVQLISQWIELHY